tara:strand:+ start:541 stop:1743 length:1203 start_codon:yes stop_codon:yes gene_type:complete
MASSASPDLKIQLMATGENSGAWGTVTNDNLSALEEAIARTTDVTFAADAPTASVTLTDSNSLQAGRNYRLNLIGTGTAGHVLLLPTVEKSYLINNTLSVDVSVRNGTAAGTNLFNTQTVPAGGSTIVYTDGSAVTSAISSASAMDIATTLDVGGAASVGGTLRAAAITGASISSLGAASVGATLGVTGNISAGGVLSVIGAISAGGTLGLTGNASAKGTFSVIGAISAGASLGVTGNASVTGTLSVTDEFTFATANSTGNLGVVKNASVGGTLLGTGGVSDADGSLRQVPQARAIDTQIGSAAATDVGNYVLLKGTASSTQVLVLPADTFVSGDILSVVNSSFGGKTAGAVTTFSAGQMNSCFVAGAETSTALVTLSFHGVASVLFVSPNGCFITGNVE